MFGTDSPAILGGLIAVGAFGLLGIGGFFTYSAAVAAPAVPLTTVVIPFTTGGQVVASYTVVTSGVTLTQQQAALLAVMQAGGMATEPVAVAAILNSWGLTFFSLDSIIALGLYSNMQQQQGQGYFDSLGNWMGPGQGGGSPNPPGFPGFGLGGNVGPSGATYGCTIVNSVWECYWYY